MQTTTQRWQIEFGGHTWTDADATIANAVAVNSVLGVPGWDAVDPWTSPTCLAAWIIVLVASKTGEDIAIVMEHINAQPLAAMIASLTMPPEELAADGAGL